MRVERIVNELMSSNCFILSDRISGSCIIIDPASKDCGLIIEYLTKNGLTPLYVILTHEHTDHTWGCGKLADTYDVKVVCSHKCMEALPRESRAYFQFYYDDPSYTYTVGKVDLTTEAIGGSLTWTNREIKFYDTPGHSQGSICIHVENSLFSGDTLMQYKPYFSRKGGSETIWNESVAMLTSLLSPNTVVYPGHGDSFLLKNYGQYD